jgi:hypothetical protein
LTLSGTTLSVAAPHRRETFLCSIAFSAHLNEPGSIAWALPLAANASNASALPTPTEMLGAADASRFFLAGHTPTGRMQALAAGVLQNATVTGLASDTAYTMVLSARDAAPLPNYIPQLKLVQLVALDVRPPLFTGASNVSLCGLRARRCCEGCECFEVCQHVAFSHSTALQQQQCCWLSFLIVVAHCDGSCWCTCRCATASSSGHRAVCQHDTG